MHAKKVFRACACAQIDAWWHCQCCKRLDTRHMGRYPHCCSLTIELTWWQACRDCFSTVVSMGCCSGISGRLPLISAVPIPTVRSFEAAAPGASVNVQLQRCKPSSADLHMLETSRGPVVNWCSSDEEVARGSLHTSAARILIDCVQRIRDSLSLLRSSSSLHHWKRTHCGAAHFRVEPFRQTLS